MLRYLLDTNTISEPARPSPNRGVLARLHRHELEIAIAAPVWHELLFGMRRLPPSAKRTRIESYLFSTVAELPILPYEAAAADWQAAERARLEAQGRVVALSDGQIAAIARVHECIVVTANVAHFELFEGIRVENWME